MLAELNRTQPCCIPDISMACDKRERSFRSGATDEYWWTIWLARSREDALLDLIKSATVGKWFMLTQKSCYHCQTLFEPIHTGCDITEMISKHCMFFFDP